MARRALCALCPSHPKLRARRETRTFAHFVRSGAALSALSVFQEAHVAQECSYPPVSPLYAGLMCRCPRCGKGRLFRGFLSLPDRCEVCGLDYAFIDAGDGPAVFVIFFSGFVVVGSALLVEAMYQPPFWVHALLWGPLILLTTLGPLRPFKGLLVALQYHHKAAEGRLERRPAD
jgi:uncharacterized protein (DUF983 family)